MSAAVSGVTEDDLREQDHDHQDINCRAREGAAHDGVHTTLVQCLSGYELYSLCCCPPAANVGCKHCIYLGVDAYKS